MKLRRFAVSTLFCSLLLGLMALFSQAALAQNYTIYDLGPFGKDTQSAAYGVNRTNKAVGVSISAANVTQAISWKLSNNKIITTPLAFGINGATFATGINDAGNVSGYYTDPEGIIHAIRTGTTGTFNVSSNDLGTLGGNVSQAYQINKKGQVVGGSGSATAPHPFFWDPTALLTDIGTLGGKSGVAYGINGLNDVVGEADTNSAINHAFLWIYSNGSNSEMDLHPVVAGRKSVVYAVNDFLQAAGWANDSASNKVAALWDVQANVFTSLGTLGGKNSQALSLNNSARISVVGTAALANGVYHAFLWDQTHKMQDLNTLIPKNSGWVLTSASAINDNGTIVGVGLYNGKTHGFLLSHAPAPFIIDIATNIVSGSQSVTGTITLPTPAPTNGVVVLLTSSSKYATVPQSARIFSGQTQATFTIKCSAVPQDTRASINGSASGYSARAALALHAASLSGLQLSVAQVQGGKPVTGTVTLNSIAPTGGILVSLASTNTKVAALPKSVAIPAGQSTVTFTVTTTQVKATSNVTITATYHKAVRMASLQVNSVGLTGLSVNPTMVAGGKSATGTVTLGGAAPTGGIVVSLQSNNSTVASVPSSVTVASGQSSASFTISTSTVTNDTGVLLSASYSGTTVTASLTVQGSGGGGTVTVQSITLNPDTVGPALDVSTGTITLSGPAPAGGVNVKVTADPTGEGAFDSGGDSETVNIPAGQTTGTFTFTTDSIDSPIDVTITGSYNGSSASAVLHITG